MASGGVSFRLLLTTNVSMHKLARISGISACSKVLYLDMYARHANWWRRPRRLEEVPSAELHVLAAVLAAWLPDVCFEPRWDAASAVRTGGL